MALRLVRLAKRGKGHQSQRRGPYARDTAGKMLAEQILKISKNPQHVHLIAHSSGCWAISEAAKIIAKKTNAKFT